MRISSGIVFLLVGTFCWGQAGAPVPASASSQDKTGQRPEKSSDPPAKTESAEDDVPAYTLQFHEQEKPIGGFVASPLIQEPVRCSTDGTPFFNMLDIPSSKDQSFDPFKQTVYSVSSKGAHSYSIKTLPDLDNVRFLALDADDSKVVLLVTGTSKDGEAGSSSASPPPPSTGSPIQALLMGKPYLAFFDHDGNYQKSAKLGVTYFARDFALLPSGEFIVFGFDEIKSVVRISLLDSDGGYLRDIPYSGELTSDPAFEETKSGTDFERESALMKSSFGSWHLAHARGKVLLYEPDSKAPVLEIGSGGARREVPLSLPKGFYLEAFMPSSDRWIARLGEDGPNKPARGFAGTSYNKNQLFELDPSDGSARYRIDLGNEVEVNPYTIACEQDGKFLAYKTDKDSKFTLVTADIAR